MRLISVVLSDGVYVGFRGEWIVSQNTIRFRTIYVLESYLLSGGKKRSLIVPMQIGRVFPLKGGRFQMILVRSMVTKWQKST